MSKRELRETIIRTIEQREVVRLAVDGFHVTARLLPINHYAWRVIVYVNGSINGKDLAGAPATRGELTEIARRFYNAQFHHLWKPADRQRLTKKFGKLGATELGVGKGFWMARPDFATARAFATNLLRNNAEVEIVGHEHDGRPA